MVEIEGFEIIEKLGTGGMATVWRARQLSLDRIVAVKILSSRLTADPSDVERFQEEARAAARLKHPGIVQVYDANAQEGVYFFVMEFVAGYTVGDWLERKGVLSEANALLVGECVADALSYAWQQAQIIHCDIKPDNVMIDADGTVKVADLGLARTLSKMGHDAANEDIMGTPAYMSPEQARGDAALDCRADIYSLGAMLYQIVTGKMLFEGSSETEIVDLQVTERVADPIDLNPRLSKAVCWLIEKMLAKDRGYRHQDWEAVRQDIKRVKKGMLPAGKKLPDGASTTRRSKRRLHHAPVYPADMRRKQEGIPPFAKVLLAVAVGLVLAIGALALREMHNRSRVSVRPPPRPVPTHVDPAPPDPVDARTQRAKEMYEFAVKWAAEHPSEREDCIRRFRQVAQEVRGTKYSLMAEDEARKLTQALESDIRKVLAELKRSTTDHIAKEEYLEAARMYEEYVGRMTEATRDVRLERAAELRKRHEVVRREREARAAEADKQAAVILEGVADAIMDGGALKGLAQLLQAVRENDQVGLSGDLMTVSNALHKACEVHRTVLDSFREYEGRRVYVELADGRHRFTIEHVLENRVEVRERTVDGAERTLSFGVNDLAPREMLSRMGSEDEPHVCLAKGLMALKSKAWTHAERYFLNVGPQLSERLLLRIRKMQTEARNESAERGLRRLLSSLGVDVDAMAYDEDAWVDAITQRQFTPSIVERAELGVSRFAAEHGETGFAKRAVPVLEVLKNAGVQPEPPALAPERSDVTGGGTDEEEGWEEAVVTDHAALEHLVADNPEMKPGAIRVLKTEDGQLYGVRIRSAGLSDIGALKELHGIRVLECIVDAQERRRLAGTSAIEKLQLRRLVLQNCRFSDIDVLADMPLEELCLRNTSVRDVAQLQRKDLRVLDISGTRVTTLSALSDLRLEELYLDGLSLRSLLFVKNMPLTKVGLAGAKVTDFAPLSSKRLTWLDLRGTAVKSLSWLADMPLETLLLADTRVSDISDLSGMKLVELTLANCEEIDDFSALRGMPLRRLDVSGTAFSDTEILGESSLTHLNIAATDVADLAGLVGARLESLNITTTDVTDLGPLSGMPLVELRCRGTAIEDFTPLLQTEIRRLWADPDACLKSTRRGMTSLAKFNGQAIPREE